jgi:hypothetical protein
LIELAHRHQGHAGIAYSDQERRSLRSIIGSLRLIWEVLSPEDEEVGSGFPLLVIPGGGLNSTVAGLATHPFNPFDEFKGEFRVIAADLRDAKGGQSTGPLEVDRPWDA